MGNSHLRGFDVLSFLTQSAGAGMLAGAKDNRVKSMRGQHIPMTGLVLQRVAYGFFSSVAIRYHLKVKVPLPENARGAE
jgi:hypothetical protein